MKKLLNKIKHFHSNEDGLETIEYALMAALVAVAIIVGAGTMGNAANTKYENVAAIISSS